MTVVPLLKCTCGQAGTRRVLRGSTIEREIIACDACFDKTAQRLAHFRPLFDQMIELGISRDIANRTMTFMLQQIDHPAKET